MAKAKKKLVCDVCNDTHLAHIAGLGTMMCTACPVPCRACRRGGNGPYCETTPCACACHHGSRHYPLTAVVVDAPASGLDTTATRAVLDDVLAERGRQHARWGQQDLPDGTTRDRAASWRAIDAQTRCAEAALLGTLTYRHILEEEIAEAMAETDPARLRVELVQSAAVIVQWIEKLDRQAKETTNA